MLYEALCASYLNDESIQQPSAAINDTKVSLNGTGKALNQLLLECYNINADDQRMRQALTQGDIGQAFDQLRKNYPQRREYSHYRLDTDSPISHQLKILGFVST